MLEPGGTQARRNQSRSQRKLVPSADLVTIVAQVEITQAIVVVAPNDGEYHPSGIKLEIRHSHRHGPNGSKGTSSGLLRRAQRS